ncbi:HAMP domain-containing protein [Glycomyces sp. TRM65418]|uniref:HAMP domain-containing sensor histidine kinase n=1 Tax=Glycomyces sp. TRM65418 TaxID=2867006 RepID=UPI001CE61EF6|nr:ATP-binding protein [Glycomyces sp. TRM65418]MCC3761831.1 HAMP domain-containing protein [Glycomyces sp. TRM65418]QZD55913.1 HAMP domain-containing protein [Glycomyces sp. TRM65418]
MIGSLRVRLALTGSLAIYLPVLLVFAVTMLNRSEESRVAPDGTEHVVASTGIEPTPWAVFTVLALLPVTAALAWWWSGRAVRPFERIREAAERIEAADLSLRVGTAHGTTEAIGLAAAFDAMLDRLERSAQVQRRLVEETSHELRTPLAVLITGADVLLRHPEPDLDLYREGLERSRNAAERLRDAVGELLVDARGRARVIDRRPTDVTALVREVFEEVGAFAASRSVRLELRGGPAEAPVDGPSIRRAVANLVHNAVKHAPAGTAVAVAVERSAGTIAVLVADAGPGVPAVERDRVFERFWRGDRAPGTGLGLPIARQIAQAHGGDVTLLDAEEGCRFRLDLPVPEA